MWSLCFYYHSPICLEDNSYKFSSCNKSISYSSDIFKFMIKFWSISSYFYDVAVFDLTKQAVSNLDKLFLFKLENTVSLDY